MLSIIVRALHLSASCLFQGSLISLLLASFSLAQVIPDTSLPNNSRVNRRNNEHRIAGGTQQGDNLFHSFQEFSVPSGETARFLDVEAIETIFVRVTGSNVSRIHGNIRADSNSNLFLINPNGILFGRNASLNIGGSFLATTAESIRFADGGQFSAANPQSSVLTVSVPTGLQFGARPQAIINRSRFPENNRTQLGLQVPNQNSLALIGGEIRLPGGIVSSVGGRVEIGAIGDSGGLVNLSLDDDTLVADYRNVPNFQDVRLFNNARIDASGFPGGSIQVQGNNVVLNQESGIVATTEGADAGGRIAIHASDSVILRNGSNIATFAAGARRAGNIRVWAADSIQLMGTAPPTPPEERSNPSSIASQVGISSQTSAELDATTGSGGNIRLNTRRLIAQNGGGVDASTFARGNAGNIFINATESITLAGSRVDGAEVRDQVPSGIFAQVADRSINLAGNAGDITIHTGTLSLLDGAQISSAGRQAGQGGRVNIHATHAIHLRGTSTNASDTVGRSGIFVSAEVSARRNAGQMDIATEELRVEAGGEISANNFGAGQGGSITINVDRLTVQDGDIRATSFKSGLAGNLDITASQIILDAGRLTATTNAGETPNANILLQSDALFLQNQSLISAEASGTASGGNVNIRTNNGFVIAADRQNNDIIASAFEGRGGNIDIEANSILGLAERSSISANRTNDIDASSRFGAPGSVTLSVLNVDPSQGLVALPETIVDAATLIAQTCPTGRASDPELSQFVITGRGGLPPSPSDASNHETVWTDWVTSSTAEMGNNTAIEDGDQPVMPVSELSSPNEIIEAQGWRVNPEGQVVLLAQATTSVPQHLRQLQSPCHS